MLFQFIKGHIKENMPLEFIQSAKMGASNAKKVVLGFIFLLIHGRCAFYM